MEDKHNKDANKAVPLMSLNDTKAGMEGLDKTKIDAIIQTHSQGSKFYAAKLKSQTRITEQVQKIQGSYGGLSASAIQQAETQADQLVAELRQGRDLSRTIVHVDMDAFYAAVEMRDQPALKTKPMAVGSLGMLSTSNYEARKFGVRAGMPGFIGLKLCPKLTLVPLNFEKYHEVSRQVRAVFREYDANFCPMSLDEAYLDLTEHLEELRQRGLDPDPRPVVQEIRAKIEAQTTLTASAGIAPNTMLAKVCSDQNKPNGQFYLPPDVEEIMAFVNPLPIRKVSGIGNVTEQLLKAVHVSTCQDLYEKRGVLKLLFSDISYHSFIRISLGIGSTRLSDWNERERKSLSTETTFRDTSDVSELQEICTSLCQDLAQELTQHGLQGRSVTLKVKTHDFQVRTKVKHLLEATAEADKIEVVAKSLLKFFMDNTQAKPLKLRLMGVRMSGWESDKSAGAGQTSIAAYMGKKRKDTTSVFDCPSCGQKIQAQSQNQFNRHLDSCLLGGESQGSTEASPKPGKKAKLDDERCISTQNAMTHSSSGPANVACPICREKLPNLDPAVNAHIDECLNRQEIAQISGNKRPLDGESSSHKRKRSKAIDQYFNKPS
ncbi:DNA polymerase kappa-like isoform X3 [Tigriopus californicus]|uniref:DNA polymerase kappa-like isoform X3 n=1 Tax=Tigriopus californicus TaxID=6832 RepID=UPI0027DA0432|nr:DNA polymerase kappa-like isoform X3 [Tigriopus californicus]